MPPRPYKSKKRTYRKKLKKANTFGNYSTTAAADKLRIKLRYSDTATMTPSTTPSNYFISANSCFDPDRTGLGHQPLGFDQYMLMYDHYKVVGSKINVWAKAASTNVQGDRCIAAIYLDDDAAAITDIHNAIEQGETQWKNLAPTSVKPTLLSKRFSLKKFLSNQKDSANVIGTAASNPAEEAFFNIVIAPLNPVDNPTDFRIHFVIDYLVEFTERKTLISS